MVLCCVLHQGAVSRKAAFVKDLLLGASIAFESHINLVRHNYNDNNHCHHHLIYSIPMMVFILYQSSLFCISRCCYVPSVIIVCPMQ